MESILPIIQIALGIIMIVGILMQRSEAGLGAVFGGGDDAFGPTHIKRGAEKVIFQGTIVVSILFSLSVVLPLFI